MSEIYNRTLLWSGAGTSSCNLSEPIQNFQYMRVMLSPNYICDTVAYSSLSKGKVIGAGHWTNASYLDWQYQYSITNSGKTVSITNFQIIQQVASSAPTLFGSANNSASNRAHLCAVWGVNRISGNPESAIGVPYTGAGWRPYNETFLASSSAYVSSFTLAEPASAFSRLRVIVGRLSESQNSFEYNTPSSDNDILTVKSYWGSTTAINGLVMTRYQWLSGTKVLSSLGGKSFALGWSANSNWSATGSTANESYRYRPIYAIYGINRK